MTDENAGPPDIVEAPSHMAPAAWVRGAIALLAGRITAYERRTAREGRVSERRAQLEAGQRVIAALRELDKTLE